jgi:AAA+ ATPase superfamily predicted ATPase
MFINRKQELESLEEEYSKNGSSFSVIYGRRTFSFHIKPI